jgi:hypothetical protein
MSINTLHKGDDDDDNNNNNNNNNNNLKLRFSPALTHVNVIMESNQQHTVLLQNVIMA